MKILLTALAALLAPALPSLAGFTTNQSATSVIGQINFTASSTPFTSSLVSLSAPEGTAVDPATGKLFVADTSSNRILRYSSSIAYSSGAAADAVFGQSNFTNSLSNAGQQVSASGLSSPATLFLDKAGRLWVADFVNGRILRYDDAANKASGAAADGVLGQPGFDSTPPSNVAPVTAGTMRVAAGITGDAAGRIWASDQFRNRILRWDNAAAKSNGAAPDAVLGQPDFTSKTADTSATGMRSPYGISIDAAGRLWVGDFGNNRVLRFDNAATKANGAAADAVLGQSDFTELAFPATSETSFSYPKYVSAAADGTVWVSDFENNRLLAFTNAAAKANGAAADLVIGQPDFTTATPTTTATGFRNPTQIAFAGSSTLFVGDFSSNRVLRFGPVPTPTPAAKPTLKTLAKATARKGTVTLKGTSTNAARITYRVGTTGAFKAATGPAASWSIKLTKLAAGKTFKVTIVATNPGGATKQTVVTVKSL